MAAGTGRTRKGELPLQAKTDPQTRSFSSHAMRAPGTMPSIPQISRFPFHCGSMPAYRMMTATRSSTAGFFAIKCYFA